MCSGGQDQCSGGQGVCSGGQDLFSGGQGLCFGDQRVCSGVQPEEGELLSVHPGAEGERGVFSEGRDDGGEDQRYQHKAGREDHLGP